MIILHDSKHASVDASDLNLTPGNFPKTLVVEVPGQTLRTFTRCGQIISRGQTAGYEYENAEGFNLVVYND